MLIEALPVRWARSALFSSAAASASRNWVNESPTAAGLGVMTYRPPRRVGVFSARKLGECGSEPAAEPVADDGVADPVADRIADASRLIAWMRDERDTDRAAPCSDAVVSNVEEARSAAHPSHADSRARPFWRRLRITARPARVDMR